MFGTVGRRQPGVLAWLTAAVAVTAVHWLAAGPWGQRGATVGEADTAAASYALARLDGVDLVVPHLDEPAIRQLAALSVPVGPVLPDAVAGSVLGTVRAAALLASLAGCLLLWPALRRLGLRPAATAIGVLAGGLPAVAVGLHGSVDAGVLAAAWLTLAVAVPGSNPGLVAVRLAAVAAATVTAPLAAVPILALLAHLVLARSRGSVVRVVAAAGLGAAAAVLAVLATGTRPLAVTGDGAVPVSALAGIALAGIGLGALANLLPARRPWVRPAGSATMVLAGCVLVGGPAATTAAALMLPCAAALLAVLVAGLDRLPRLAGIDQTGGGRGRSGGGHGHAGGQVGGRRGQVGGGRGQVGGGRGQVGGGRGRSGRWPGRLAAAAALLCVAGSAVLGVPAIARPVDASSPDHVLARWVDGELDPGTALVVDSLTWVQLVSDGIAVERLWTVGGPVRGRGRVILAGVGSGGAGRGQAGRGHTGIGLDGLGHSGTGLGHSGTGLDRLPGFGPLGREQVVGVDTTPAGALIVVVPRDGRRSADGPQAGPSVQLATIRAERGVASAEVRQPVVDVAATHLAAELDRDDRRRVGALLAANPRLTLEPVARADLLDGAVDARLIAVLAAFASVHQLRVTEFPAGPMEPAGAPHRAMRLASVDGSPASVPGLPERVQGWFAAQLPPYRPLTVRDEGGQLVVRYPAPAPLGLLAH